jgi:RecA/RadA recombinase
MAAKKTTTTKKANDKKPKSSGVSGGLPPAAVNSMGVPPPPEAVSRSYNERVALLDAVASQVNEDGHMALVRADQAPNPYILRRPTGIMPLDIDLGGGWPAGGMCFLSGPDNAGKTWLLLVTMAMQQRIYGEHTVLGWAITEGPFPYDQAVMAGLRVKIPDPMITAWNEQLRQRGLTPYTDEQFAAFKYQPGDFRIIRGSTGEEILDTVLKVVATRACSCVGIDSIQGLNPAANADKDMGENDKRAAHATMMGQFFAKYVPLTTGISGVNETTLLMTQQVRANPAKATANPAIAKFLPDYAVSGSWSARHYKLIDLIVSSGSVKKLTRDGKTNVPVGKTMKWHTEKGKAGTHDNINGEVYFSYELSQGVDFAQTVMDVGMALKVICTDNKKIVLVRPETGQIRPEFTSVSVSAFKKAIEVSPDFDIAVRMEILAAAGKKCLYR